MADEWEPHSFTLKNIWNILELHLEYGNGRKIALSGRHYVEICSTSDIVKNEMRQGIV